MRDKDYIESAGYDFFYQGFYSGKSLRPVCFSCPYTNLHRTGDITIGDFWGIEHVFPEIDDDKGVSLVLINSQKGKEIFLKIKAKFLVKETSIEKCMQPSLEISRKKPREYEQFWRAYQKKGFLYVCKKYLNGGMKGKAKKFVKTLLKKC